MIRCHTHCQNARTIQQAIMRTHSCLPGCLLESGAPYRYVYTEVEVVHFYCCSASYRRQGPLTQLKDSCERIYTTSYQWTLSCTVFKICYIWYSEDGWYSEEGLGGVPAQSPPRCTECNSPPINGQCTNHRNAVRSGLGGLRPRSHPSSLYQM